MEGRNMDLITCQNPKCTTAGPVFDEAGQHNFCPASADNGNIIIICMKCKQKEIIARWAKN